MLENFENSEELSDRAEGLSETELNYLRELEISNKDWDNLDDYDKAAQLRTIDDRMDELGVAETDRQDMANNLYSSHLSEAFGDYIYNSYFNPSEDYSPTSWDRLPGESDDDYNDRIDDQNDIIDYNND